jgi:hypothetical protein
LTVGTKRIEKESAKNLLSLFRRYLAMEKTRVSKVEGNDLFDTVELGNLFFGHSRGEFSVPREWQDLFCDFLERCGFDSYGYMNDELEKKYLHTNYALEDHLKDCNLSVEQVKKEGQFIKEDKYGTEYIFSDKRYLIVSHPDEDYDEAFDNWFEMEPEDSDDLYRKYCEFEPDPDNYGKTEEVYELEGFESHMHYFDNDVFIVRPYYWGDSDEISELPNFEFGDFELRWYKYPLRDSYCNMDISFEDFKKMLETCEASIIKELKEEEVTRSV